MKRGKESCKKKLKLRHSFMELLWLSLAILSVLLIIERQSIIVFSNELKGWARSGRRILSAPCANEARAHQSPPAKRALTRLLARCVHYTIKPRCSGAQLFNVLCHTRTRCVCAWLFVSISAAGEKIKCWQAAVNSPKHTASCCYIRHSWQKNKIRRWTQKDEMTSKWN
jgi:hypothetical protein